MNKKLNYLIAYYSGTGGTEMVANCFVEKLKEVGTVVIEKITNGNSSSNNSYDMLILIFPVHAFNAPEPVYKWIKNIEYVTNLPAAVISVSGAGEISPNTASRLSTIKGLKKKGFDVRYEKMLVMPSNFLFTTNEITSIMLLKILPLKVKKIINDIESNIVLRSKPLLIDKIISRLGELEKLGAKFFGKHIKASSNCNSCGLCVRDCPANNISMKRSMPYFHYKCNLCLKCIYSCPRKALSPKLGKFVILKQGYNLLDLKNKINSLPDNVDINNEAKGYAWSGVRKYFSEQ